MSCLLRSVCFGFFAGRPARALQQILVPDQATKGAIGRPWSAGSYMQTGWQKSAHCRPQTPQILRSTGWIASFADGKGPKKTWWSLRFQSTARFGPKINQERFLGMRQNDHRRPKICTMWSLNDEKLWTSWPSWCILDHYQPLSTIVYYD